MSGLDPWYRPLRWTKVPTSAAEDVVQDAFLGLYRRWDSLSGPSAAFAYLRASVVAAVHAAAGTAARPPAAPTITTDPAFPAW
jgi:DNA-directed RNA polymerase specialized sigma24 family protein